jgi:hypothetical protein
MNITNYIAASMPVWLNKGVQLFIENRTRPKFSRPDPIPQFLDKQLALLTEMSEKNNPEANVPAAPGRPGLPGIPGNHLEGDPDCPYCAIHELTGHARNLLEFAARQCANDELAPATGGTIPQAKGYIEQAIAIADTSEAEGTMKMLLNLVKETGENITPKLDEINSCEEAVAAAEMAERLWLLSAKTAQTYYAGPKALT